MQHSRILINVLIALFVIVEMGAYFFIEQQVKSDVDNEVQQHYESIDKEINTLMEYKEKITTGKLGEYGPDQTPMNLEWFEGKNWTLYPDSTYPQARMKHFISSFSNDVLFTVLQTPNHKIMKEMESVYPIYLPGTVWEIEQLYKSASSLYVKHIVPYAWGYKKCKSYEKRFRPTGYAACIDAYEYLTQEDTKISTSFTEGTGKINAILSLSNKYFYIERADRDEFENRQREINSQFGYIHNNYYVVFYEEDYPEVEYKICSKVRTIEKEILNRTLNIFIITTIILLLAFIGGYYMAAQIQKNNEK